MYKSTLRIAEAARIRFKWTPERFQVLTEVLLKSLVVGVWRHAAIRHDVTPQRL